MKKTVQQKWEHYAAQRGYVVKCTMKTVKTDTLSWTAWMNFKAGHRAAHAKRKEGEL